MSPVNDHLKRNEIKDFSKGLWDGQDFLMPADAFQVMTDCYPRESGGLRSFFKPAYLFTTGLDLVNERVVWIEPLGQSTGLGYLLITQIVATGAFKGWHAAPAGNSWTLDKTFTAPANIANGPFMSICTYHGPVTTEWIVGTTHNGAGDGIWAVSPTGTWTQIDSSAFDITPVVQYQARLLACRLNTIIWTDPGTHTFSAPNFLTLLSGNNDIRDIIACMITYSPSTLLIATAGSGWWLIEGDLTDPVVREMGKDHYPWDAQRMARTENGIVFMEPDGGIYLTQNMGANFQRLDPQRKPLIGGPQKGFSYFNNFLFAPEGRVCVMNNAAMPWFTLSEASGATPVYAWMEQPGTVVNGITMTRSILGGQTAASGKILVYDTGERAAARYETYTVKTAPLRGDAGRQVQIREVQVAVDSFNTAATVAVTVNGTTRTSDALGAGKNVVSFLFRESAEYLDIQVVPNSNLGGTEAPTLESLVFYTRGDAHQIHYTSS